MTERDLMEEIKEIVEKLNETELIKVIVACYIILGEDVSAIQWRDGCEPDKETIAQAVAGFKAWEAAQGEA